MGIKLFDLNNYFQSINREGIIKSLKVIDWPGSNPDQNKLNPSKQVQFAQFIKIKFRRLNMFMIEES